MAGWVWFLLGVAAIPVGTTIYGLGWEAWRLLKKAARRRRKGPANGARESKGEQEFFWPREPEPLDDPE